MRRYKNPLKKNLLILSGGIEALEGIKVAKKMGLRTIVCDGNKNAPGRSYADEFLIGNIYDPDEIKNIISKYAKKNSEREHVTSYFYNNPEKFKIILA